jgi:CDP-2,3-bis-(O-geranylgeranyl)-sn-glycerol synthase
MSNSLTLAVFLLIAMSIAGAAHVIWVRWARTGLLLTPVDLGHSFRGRRIFGDNKRLRGFIVLPLVAAGTFAIVAANLHRLPPSLTDGLWQLSTLQSAGIGLAAGLAFMLAELPNSFVKRRLGIAPGQVPGKGWSRAACLLLDRFDSALGVLVVVSVLAPVPAMTWLWVLLIGPGLHALFSALLFRIGVKERAL